MSPYGNRKSGNPGVNLRRITSTVILPVGTLRNVTTDLHSVVLIIYSRGRWMRKVLPRTAISNIRNIPELANYGVDVDSENAREIMRWLSDFMRFNRNSLPETLLTNKLGFIQDTAGGFMHGATHIPSEKCLNVQLDQNVLTDSSLVSAYRTGGTMEEWRLGVEQLVPYPVALLTVIASLAAPMLTVLDSQCPSFTVSLAGRTSTGKTISLMCGASCWGAPLQLCKSWSSTNIGLERQLGLVANMPVFLDDTKLAKNDDFVRDAVYMIQQEVGMGRGKPGGLATQETWRTIVISSGESSLGSFFNDGGARARYFEVHDPPFGGESMSTAQIVKGVKRAFLENYGHAGPALIKVLFETAKEGGWDRIKARHLQIQNDFARDTTGGAGDRVAGYAAALQVTAEVAVQAGILPEACIKVVPELWPRVAQQANEAPVEERALIALFGWMLSHQEQFWGRHRMIADNPITPSNGFVGAWVEKPYWKNVSFFRDRLDSILQELGFRHPDGVLRGWKDRGYLITNRDANRLDRTTSFRGEPARMVTIKRSAFEEAHGRDLDVELEGEEAAKREPDLL